MDADGYISIGNKSSLAIEIDEENNKAKLWLNTESVKKPKINPKWQNIKENNKGQYVRFYGRVFYIVDFIKA